MHSRTRRLLGDEAIRRLQSASVLVAGLGGVGGSCALALARGGIGRLTVVDGDAVALSNLNRQAVAFRSTLGMEKAIVTKEQIADIDPGIRVCAHTLRIDGDNAAQFIRGHSFVVDAVDDVQAKVALALACREEGIPIVSSMGAGNRLDPSGFRIVDIAKTHTDPLARTMRRLLRQVGIEHLPVCWSPEEPIQVPPDEHGRHTPASCSFVPPAAGLVLAGYVNKEIIKGVSR